MVTNRFRSETEVAYLFGKERCPQPVKEGALPHCRRTSSPKEHEGLYPSTYERAPPRADASLVCVCGVRSCNVERRED